MPATMTVRPAPACTNTQRRCLVCIQKIRSGVSYDSRSSTEMAVHASRWDRPVAGSCNTTPVSFASSTSLVRGLPTQTTYAWTWSMTVTSHKPSTTPCPHAAVSHRDG